MHNRKKTCCSGWLVLVLNFSISLPLFAAGPTGSIAGTVLDSTGAAVTSAKVTVRAPATGFSREVSSATDGGYVVPLLPVGRYTVIVEAPAFNRFEQDGVEVRAEISSTVHARLTVGDVKETVTVEGSSELLDTRTGTLRETIEQRTIEDLPLDGRNAAELVLLSAGTSDLTNGGTGQAASGGSGAGTYGDLDQPVTYPGAMYISSNGAQGQGVTYLLDGASNNDPYSNINSPFPNPDVLEEFAVQTSNYSAEYGRGVGAVVSIVTNSGANQLHGDAFEYVRNGDFNAARYAFGAQSSPDQLKRNQFGGSLGGPIVKNKLFYFGNYQGTIEHNVANGLVAHTMSTPERSGDFSADPTITDPLTGNPFPNNQIPIGRLDPATKNLLNYLPSSTTGTISFTQPGIVDDEHQFFGRVDYNTDRNRLYGRDFFTHYTQDPYVGKTNLFQANPGEDFTYQTIAAVDTFDITSNLLNTLLVAHSMNAGKTATGAPFGAGANGLGVNITTPALPEIFISVGGVFTIQTGHFRNIRRGSYQIADTLHWAKGKHEIAMGGDFLQQNLNEQNNYMNSGKFYFGSRYTGFPLADLFLGGLQKFDQGGGEYQNRTANLGSLFVNDNYRVLRNLTVNLGVRWDPYVPFSDSLGRTECYRSGLQSTRFPNAPLGYLFAGDKGCPGGGADSTMVMLSPRAGFSYDLRGDGKTVVRGGAGFFTQPPYMGAFNDFSDSAPFSPQFYFDGGPSSPIQFSDPYAGSGVVNPFPAQFSPYSPTASATFSTPVVGRSWSPNWHPMQLLSWNLTLERQLRKDTVARVAYVGSKGTHESYNIDANQMPWSQCSQSAEWANNGSCFANQNFSQVTEDYSGGNSIYHSIQTSLDKRFASGFSLNANYTWSKFNDWISYQSDTDSINVINPFAPGAYAGTSDLEVKDRLTLRGVWEIPGPKRGAAHLALADWQVSGLSNWQSGTPFTVFDGGDASFTGISNELADFNPAVPLRYTRGSLKQRIGANNTWFNIDAFQDNALGTFGNTRRNMLFGPRSFGADMALQKHLVFEGRWKVEFRADLFNALNHANFGVPDSTYADGAGLFGAITTAGSPRDIQLALKLNF